MSKATFVRPHLLPSAPWFGFGVSKAPFPQPETTPSAQRFGFKVPKAPFPRPKTTPSTQRIGFGVLRASFPQPNTMPSTQRFGFGDPRHGCRKRKDDGRTEPCHKMAEDGSVIPSPTVLHKAPLTCRMFCKIYDAGMLRIQFGYTTLVKPDEAEHGQGEERPVCLKSLRTRRAGS